MSTESSSMFEEKTNKTRAVCFKSNILSSTVCQHQPHQKQNNIKVTKEHEYCTDESSID